MFFYCIIFISWYYIIMENQTQQDQNQPVKQLTKKERRELRREEKRVEQEKTRKVKGRKNIFVWAIVFALVAAGGFGIYRYLFGSSGEDTAFDPTNSCVTHSGGMHIHSELRIVINGEAQEIPANIGVSPGCMRPIHTHDATGKLHNEFPQHRNFTLGEFFKIWDKTFSSSQILDYTADETHKIRMTVNGEDNADFDNLILKDGDKIEIRYGGK